MQNKILADNWTFQDAGVFLNEGLSGDTASELEIPEEGDLFGYRYVSEDIVRFDALCQLLTSIVLYDEIFVDGEYSYTWDHFELLGELQNSGVVVPKPFRVVKEDWIKTREAMGDVLCVNDSLLKAHQKNKIDYAASGESSDPMLAQLIWGGSGMLARAAHFDLAYSTHPLRERLFQKSHLINRPDAGKKFENYVSAERIKIFETTGEGGFSGVLNLPPIVAQVIEESTSVGDLIPTALQLRGEFQKLRRWLGQLQNDFKSEDIKAVLKHTKLLNSISSHIDSFSGTTAPGNTTFSFDLAIVKVAQKGTSLLGMIQNKFGMRAELTKLILAPAGLNAVDKLLKMLGEKNTKLGLEFKRALRKRADVPNLTT